MRECACEVPVRKVNPGRERYCVKCGFYISPEWSSNDANFTVFANYLTSCQTAPVTIGDFIALCERRERYGRKHFGYRYLGRDNIVEAAEEAADLALYPYLELLKARRAGDEDEGRDLLMLAAFYAAQAYDALVKAALVRGSHAP